VIEFVKELNVNINNETAIMVGNIVTKWAAIKLMDAGADILKVGIGGGAACSTRVVTGFGMPNITAIMNVKSAVKMNKFGRLITIVADGGIRNSADAAKAFAAGADCVMLGSLFAGTDESPGDVINGKKLFRGMSSSSAQTAYRGMTPGIVAEGVSVTVPCKGPVQKVVDNLTGGLRSSLTYGDATNLKEFYKNTQFVKVTRNSIAESRPHILDNKSTKEE